VNTSTKTWYNKGDEAVSGNPEDIISKIFPPTDYDRTVTFSSVEYIRIWGSTEEWEKGFVVSDTENVPAHYECYIIAGKGVFFTTA